MKILVIGSMQFYEKFKMLKKNLEKKEHKVVIPLPDAWYTKEDPDNADHIKKEAVKDFVKNLKETDAVLVANYNKPHTPDYIGANTLMEIGMAFISKKKIFILNEYPLDSCYELAAMNVIELKGDLVRLR